MRIGVEVPFEVIADVCADVCAEKHEGDHCCDWLAIDDFIACFVLMSMTTSVVFFTFRIRPFSLHQLTVFITSSLNTSSLSLVISLIIVVSSSFFRILMEFDMDFK